MLVFNEERLVPTDLNVLVFAMEDESGYFYIHRSLYDQAVILNDLYRDNVSELIQTLSGDTQIRDDVEYFMSKAPEPISILGPFLLLVKEPIDTFIDMAGALSVISMQCDLRNMIRVPAEVRASLKYSLHIKEEYQLSWDRFLASSIPYKKPVLLSPYEQTPVATTEQPVAVNDPAAPVVTVNEKGEEVIDLTDAFEEFDALFASSSEDGKDAEVASEESSAEETKAPETPPKKLSGLDLVRSFI